jgi:ribose transport system permease protein
MTRRFLARYGTAVGGAIVFVFFAATADNFLNVANLVNITRHISFITVLAIGFSLALTTGELDLSFANVSSFAAVATGGLVHAGYPVPLAIATGLGIGLACGIANGLLVTLVRIPSLIATLAMASVAHGMAFLVTGGVAFVGRWPTSFTAIGRGSVLGVPLLPLWVAAIALAALFVLKQTRLGLRMVSTGEAAESARLSGIDVRAIKVVGLALSGLTAGITAILLAAALSSAAPTSGGDFMLTTIAAVLLGMTMFEPGRPNVPGTIVGALTIGVLANGLVLLGAPYYIHDIALGVIIVLSVAISASTLKKVAFTI